eukprot:c23532_g2_i2 orf=484-798(+)
MLVSFDPHLGTACPQLCRSEVYASFAFNKSSIMKYLYLLKMKRKHLDIMDQEYSAQLVQDQAPTKRASPPWSLLAEGCIVPLVNRLRVALPFSMRWVAADFCMR